jgi:hypothetical protein
VHLLRHSFAPQSRKPVFLHLLEFLPHVNGISACIKVLDRRAVAVVIQS